MQYANNIKVLQTMKWADKVVAWYRIDSTSSIVVIKQHVIRWYHVMHGAW